MTDNRFGPTRTRERRVGDAHDNRFRGLIVCGRLPWKKSIQRGVVEKLRSGGQEERSPVTSDSEGINDRRYRAA
jgi:hypothetical protein